MVNGIALLGAKGRFADPGCVPGCDHRPAGHEPTINGLVA